MQKKFTISDAFEYGWSKTKEYLNFFLLFLIASFLTSLLLNIFSSGNTFTQRISAILSCIFSLMIAIGLTKTVIRILHNELPTFDDFILRDGTEAVSFIVALILYVLIVIAGLFLFIIPGIILAVRLKFYPYLVIEKKFGPINALRTSFIISKGETLNLIGFTFLVIGLNLLASFLLGIGLIFTIPMSIIAMGYIYQKLANEEPQIPVPVESSQL